LNLFDKLNDWVNNVEGSIVNFLTAFAPWLAPLAPAYMTYQHMISFLQFPVILAFGLAILVEVLGFGSVSTFLDFYFHNRREKAGLKKAPTWAVVVSFSFYLGLIVVSNVLIDLAKTFGSPEQLQWAVISVRALLTLQTIPAAIIVGVRTGHRGLLKQIKLEKLEKDERSSDVHERSQMKREHVHERSANYISPSQREQQIYAYLEQTYSVEHRIPGATEIATKLDLDPYRAKGYISERTKSWKSSKGLLQ
jgi:hypothetical protein